MSSSVAYLVPAIRSKGLIAVNDNARLNDRDERMFMMLGELTAGLSAVRDDMAEMKTVMAEDRKASSQSRQRMYEKIDHADNRITQLESAVRVVGEIAAKQTTRIDAMEPTVAANNAVLGKWAWGIGAVVTAAIAVGSGAWWLIVNYGGAIWNALLLALPRT